MPLKYHAEKQGYLIPHTGGVIIIYHTENSIFINSRHFLIIPRSTLQHTIYTMSSCQYEILLLLRIVLAIYLLRSCIFCLQRIRLMSQKNEIEYLVTYIKSSIACTHSYNIMARTNSFISCKGIHPKEIGRIL